MHHALVGTGRMSRSGRLLALLTFAALFAASCGGSDDEPKTATIDPPSCAASGACR